MGVSINIDGAISDYKRSGRSTKFENSLRKIFEYAKNDSKVTSISDLAYLLATAKSESDYSLERWEADYLCGKTGVAYNVKPCEKALNYYRSTTGGKKNYYTLGTDKNGLPYFGRGLIQLTGKANYQSYGDLIGVDLVNDGDKALEPKNSYKIATSFLSKKRGGIYAKNGVNRSTFDMARDGNLTLARKSVNGGSKGLSEVNSNYDLWKQILEKNKSTGIFDSSSDETDADKKKRIVKRVVAVGIAVAVLGISGTLTYLYLKKKGKLPNFMKKINI
jgi:predicted chitinase